MGIQTTLKDGDVFTLDVVISKKEGLTTVKYTLLNERPAILRETLPERKSVTFTQGHVKIVCSNIKWGVWVMYNEGILTSNGLTFKISIHDSGNVPQVTL